MGSLYPFDPSITTHYPHVPIGQLAFRAWISTITSLESRYAVCDPACVAHRVEELDTWKLCNEIVERLAAATQKPAVAKDFRFCEQINDAAGDALSDLAEGFARFNPTDHANFLTYAIASLEEVRTRAGLGYKRKYFDEKTTSDLMNLCYRAESAIKHHRAYLWSVKPKDLPPRPDLGVPPNRRRPKNSASRRKPRDGTGTA